MSESNPGDLDFGDKLAALCSAEALAARADADRFGVMIERLASALGYAVAMAARGDGKVMEEMLAGAEGHAFAEATAKAKFARLMDDILPRTIRPKE